jgi:hypothetical protein
MTSKKLTACLACVPSITEVSIVDDAEGLDDAVLEAMTPQLNKQPLNHRLEVIHFIGRAYKDEVLLKMLESRWNPLTSATSQMSFHVSRPKVVRVNLHKNADEALWGRLRNLHMEGLDTMGPVDAISS